LHQIRGHGFYTPDDVAWVVEHAANLSVRVVPEVDLPAHTASWRTQSDEHAADHTAAAETKPPGATDRDGTPGGAAAAAAPAAAAAAPTPGAPIPQRSSAFAECALSPAAAARFPGFRDLPPLKRLDLVSLSPAGEGAAQARALAAKVCCSGAQSIFA
jgi:hypothetical protein